MTQLIAKKEKKVKKQTQNKNVKVAAIPNDSKSNRLNKKQKQEIEAQADAEEGEISLEVGKLLAHLKKEHGIVDVNENELPIASDSPGKKKKGDKNKLKAKTVEIVAEEKKVVKALTNGKAKKPITLNSENKQKNKKRKLDVEKSSEDTSVAKETAPSKSKKQKKHVEAITNTEPSKPKKQKKDVEADDTKEVTTITAPSKAKKQKKLVEAVVSKEVTTSTGASKPKKQKKHVEAGDTTEVITPESEIKIDDIKKSKNKKNKNKETAGVTNTPGVADATIGKKNKKSTENETEALEDKAQLLKNAFPIYVGNLPNNIKKKRVLNAFKKFGTVLSIRFRTNNGKQINKKVKLDKVPFIIAFVYFKDQESAQKSLTMNGQKIGESIIKVDADLKESSPNYNPKCTIFVGNLKFAVTDEILHETFKCCGEIKYTRIIQCDKGCNGTAFVCFKKAESVTLALKLNNTLVLDREIRVTRYHTKKLGAAEERNGKNKIHNAERRIGVKQNVAGKGNVQKNVQNKNKGGTAATAGSIGKKPQGEKNKKAKEFLGTKSNDKKKKLNKKKSKLTGEKLLAKKIAPKTLKPTA